MLHLQISSGVLALACWELHSEYGKHPTTYYSNVESQMDFFFKDNYYFKVTLQSFLQRRFQKRKGEGWEVQAHWSFSKDFYRLWWLSPIIIIALGKDILDITWVNSIIFHSLIN